MEVSREVAKSLDKAKIGLMSREDSVFLTHILFSLKMHWTTAVPTAATNGLDLYINPDFWQQQTPGQQQFVLAHEAWHPALQHITRGIGYDHKNYNIAGDYVINLMLKKAGFELIPNIYCDDMYDNMTTEQVYADIIKNPPPPQSGGMGNDILQGGEAGLPDDSTTGKSPEEIKNIIDSAIIKANIQRENAEYEGAGMMPGDLERYIEELLNPKLPWNVILQNYVNAFNTTEYSFSRPRKKPQLDFILPSLRGTTIDHIAIAVDSSGSVHDKEFCAFLREIEAIKDFTQPNRISIIDFDSDIKHVHTLTPDDSVWNIKFEGYGGTRLGPPFKKAKELKPDLFIVFSDLDCPAYKEETPFPVVWIAVNARKNVKTYFGTRIDMEIDCG